MFNVNIRKIALKEESGPQNILSNISFNLLQGNVYCIIGKNGSGKSTLLKSLTSLHNKNIFEVEGTVIYKAVDLLSLPEERLLPLREKYLKYVFQDPVSSFNPLKKLDWYFKLPGVNGDKLDSLLKKLLLPDKNEIGKLYSYELSGGMAQRFSIALALAASPVILFLDEPNSGIDYPLSNIISNQVRKFTAGTNAMVLIITQDIAFAENTSNYIGIINNGTFSGFIKKEEFFSAGESHSSIKSFVEAYKSI